MNYLYQFGPYTVDSRKRTLSCQGLPVWRDTTIIRDNVFESVRALKGQAGKNILTDGSSQLVPVLLTHNLVDELHLLVYPLALGSGKRVLPSGVHSTFRLISAKPYPSGVVGLHYAAASDRSTARAGDRN